MRRGRTRTTRGRGPLGPQADAPLSHTSPKNVSWVHFYRRKEGCFPRGNKREKEGDLLTKKIENSAPEGKGNEMILRTLLMFQARGRNFSYPRGQGRVKSNESGKKSAKTQNKITGILLQEKFFPSSSKKKKETSCCAEHKGKFLPTWKKKGIMEEVYQRKKSAPDDTPTKDTLRWDDREGRFRCRAEAEGGKRKRPKQEVSGGCQQTKPFCTAKKTSHSLHPALLKGGKHHIF